MYKRGSFIGLIYLFLLSITLSLCAHSVEASSFNNVSVRFDRMKISSATAGLVCATPATTSTENTVKVTFPNGFAIHNLSSWTVSTANIPAGSTPWTSIGNATGISGQTVTFPSGDLNPNTNYCFQWNDSSALSTGPSQANYSGTIATFNSGDAVIDSSVFAVTLVPSDNVTVTATIMPNATQIDTIFSSTPSVSTVFHEDDTFTLTFQYRSSYSTPSPVTISASWAQGTIQNTGDTIDIVSYVVGSATDADDSTPPIVDLQNKTITWSIPALASSVTYHEVSYQLKVRSTFPTSSNISMTATAGLSAFNTVLAQDTLAFTFLQSITPTPTPTQSPSALTSTPTPTATANNEITPSQIPITPTQAPSDTYIKKVDLLEITKSASTVLVESNNPVKVRISYGTSPVELDKQIDNNVYHLLHKIHLTNLLPETTYYLVIEVTDMNGSVITSDIMSFKTTRSTASLVLKPEQITLSTDQSPLTSPNTLILVVPFNKPLKISLNIPSTQFISYITARFERKDVLGISTAKRNTPVEETKFIEVLPGTYVAEILSPPSVGTYEIVLSVHDIYGSFFLVPLLHTIIISKPVHIFDKDTGQPIEGADVNISKYEPSVKTFSSLSTVLTIKKHSDERGDVDVTLPVGRYIAEITAPGYKTVSYNFTLDQLSATYPVIALTKESGVPSALSYYRGTYTLLYSFFNETISSLFSSGIFVNGSVILVQLLIISSLLLLISLRTHSGIIMTILMLPLWLWKELLGVFGYYPRHHVLIIEDDYSYHGLAGCRITIKQGDKNIKKTHAGIWGELIIDENLIKSANTEIELSKKGYKTNTICLDQALLTQDIIHFPMHRLRPHHDTFLDFVGWFTDQLIMSFYDFCIASMIIFSILFVKYKGIAESIPFIIFTTILTLLWGIYIYKVWLSIKKYVDQG